MSIRFLYLVLENGITFYHHIDPEYKDQFQDDLLGNLLSTFQSASKFIFKSEICKIQLDRYAIIIRQVFIQDLPVSIIIGTDTINLLQLTRFTEKFVNMFQSLLQFWHFDLHYPETNSEFQKKIDIIYNQLRESIVVYG